tara:strand:+ start:756 stop:1427 length:672 start_codon:yes stop_codon:yes gene_type:complete
MQVLHDLFGNPVEQSNKTPTEKAKPKPRAKVQLNRRQIWSDAGYLADIEATEDDLSLIALSSPIENAIIERLESALQMVPKLKNGEWVYDGLFWDYKIKKPIIGDREFGQRGSILRESTQYLIQASARKVLDESYVDTGSWVPTHASLVFSKRLRMALPYEDPYEILKAFTAIISQHDYLDESRKGESVRRAIKRERIREQRAAARKDRKAQAGSNEAVLKTA